MGVVRILPTPTNYTMIGPLFTLVIRWHPLLEIMVMGVCILHTPTIIGLLTMANVSHRSEQTNLIMLQTALAFLLIQRQIGQMSA